jgi:glycosyltransferase involved in cell wall biosynthesis
MPHTLNILYVSPEVVPFAKTGGLADVAGALPRALAERGHRIALLRPSQGRDDREPHARDNVWEVPTPGAPMPFYKGLQLGLPAASTLSKTVRTMNAELVYIATEGPLGISAQRVARRQRLPVVAGFHTRFENYSRHYRLGLLAPTVLAYLRRFHNRCNATLVPTRELAEELEAQDFRRLKVWARGVDTDLFSPSRRDMKLRHSWGLRNDAPAVIYVGRIAREKNIGLAIEAFQAIKRQRPEARLVFVGDGPERAHLEQKHPEFVFAGAHTGEALGAHYASGDLFLFPSLTETFGNVVLEAMSSGLAVVAYRTAAAGEIIDHGRNGLLAPPDDRIEFIRQAVLGASDDLPSPLGGPARETAERHSWPMVIAQLEQVFHQVLQVLNFGVNGFETLQRRFQDTVPQRLDIAADHGQRCPQVVRNLADEILE